MQCPDCHSEQIRKNGHRHGQQNHRCVDCGRQFINQYVSQEYSADIKRLCLRMYVNGMGIRGIARVTGISHPTVMNWIKQSRSQLPDAYDPDEIFHVREPDELETFVGSKEQKVWIWAAVDHFRAGILGWAVGGPSTAPFRPLWQAIALGRGYFWVSDGNPVYPGFLPKGDQIVSKTYMTRVEGENTRLRHSLARLHRKTWCYSKSIEMLRHSIRLLIHYLKFGLMVR